MVTPARYARRYTGPDALSKGVEISGPAIVNPGETTYLVEPGWRYVAAAQGAVWFICENDTLEQ